MAKIDGDMYRIGDYSRFMGVSPDLLKHYERCGLLEAITEENGYRYYQFHQSTRLLECMRLKNYGFSLSEMQTLLGALPYDGVKQQLDAQIDEMEARIRFEQQVIREHRLISRWMDMMHDRERQLLIDDMEPCLFLPHSRHRDFIKDDRISALLEAWVSAMPMVKSCRYFPDVLAADAVTQAYWGLLVRQSAAQELNLPVNDVVIRIPGGRSVHLHVNDEIIHGSRFPDRLSSLIGTLRSSGVKPGAPALQIRLMTMDRSEQSHRECCVFCAPLDD